MQTDIHPKYGELTATCSCGNVIKTRSTLQGDIHIDVCSRCHPFFTGKQKIVDSGGRVDRFRKRFGDRRVGGAKTEAGAKASAQPEAKASQEDPKPPKAKAARPEAKAPQEDSKPPKAEAARPEAKAPQEDSKPPKAEAARPEAKQTTQAKVPDKADK